MEFFGYIKANKLTEEYIIRQDMNKNNEPIVVSEEYYNSKNFYANNKKINLKNTFFINKDGIGISNNFTNIEGEYKNWAEVSVNLTKEQIDTILNDYKERTELIDTIIEKILDNNINGIIINFGNVNQNDSILRFVIEIAPRLRELGISTGIIVNEKIEKDNSPDIVDYFIE